jgi:hypothetical protein
MMLTIDADDAWWPPTLSPDSTRRTRLAWWTMLTANQRTRRWTASSTSREGSAAVGGRAGIVTLKGRLRIRT